MSRRLVGATLVLAMSFAPGAGQARHGSTETRTYVGGAALLSLAAGCIVPRADIAGACFRLHGVEKSVAISVRDLVTDPLPVAVGIHDANGNEMAYYEYCSVGAATRTLSIPAGSATMVVIVGGFIPSGPACGSPVEADTLGTISVSFT